MIFQWFSYNLLYMSAFDQFVNVTYHWSHMTCRMHFSNMTMVISYLLALSTFAMLNTVTMRRNITKYIWNVWKQLYDICTMAVKNATLSKSEQFVLIFFLFTTIILFNVAGLATFSFTVTATLILPLFIAYLCFVWMYLWGIQNKYWSIITQFLPTGLPLALVLLFVLLEVVSNFARLISLSVRLFANMVAGHIMLKLITSAFVKILSTKFLVPLIVILILFTLIYSLELFIAFLQAFVFILLLNLYLKDFVIIHHQT